MLWVVVIAAFFAGGFVGFFACILFVMWARCPDKHSRRDE